LDASNGRIPDLDGSPRVGPESSRKLSLDGEQKISFIARSRPTAVAIAALRLSDLGHLWRGREAFKRWREDCAGVGRAASRLIELGERQRGEQLVTARALPLCDSDRGQEGVFRGRGVGGVAFQQDFAANPMQFRFKRAIAQAVARCQRFVDDRNRTIGIAPWSLTSLKEKLIKIGAKVVSHGRYVAFQMAEVAIPRNLFADILRLIGELRPPPVTSTG
jgi:hypothetical protein